MYKIIYVLLIRQDLKGILVTISDNDMLVFVLFFSFLKKKKNFNELFRGLIGRLIGG